MEDDTDNMQINTVMNANNNLMQNSSKGPARGAQNQGPNFNTNQLVPLTVRRPGTLDPYELSYQLVYDINVVST
jgi:hypothetical protein